MPSTLVLIPNSNPIFNSAPRVRYICGIISLLCLSKFLTGLIHLKLIWIPCNSLQILSLPFFFHMLLPYCSLDFPTSSFPTLGLCSLHKVLSMEHSFLYSKYSTLNSSRLSFFRAVPMAYGGSQVRGRIGAAAASLCHSSQQQQILSPLSEARHRTCILMDTSQICFHWTIIGTPKSKFQMISKYLLSE